MLEIFLVFIVSALLTANVSAVYNFFSLRGFYAAILKGQRMGESWKRDKRK